ncbi:MAG: hypothetical protein JKX79_07045 [Labilibaculum sp.]|nr:hypothetical protein [Labilibaculum sp.]
MKDNILWYFENFNFLDSLTMKEKLERNGVITCNRRRILIGKHDALL